MSRPQIFSKSFWRTYWIAIRRSGRDKRDLKAALLITVGLLFFVGYYGFLLINFLSVSGDAAMAVVVVFVLCAIALVRYIFEQRDKRKADRADEAAVDQEVRRRLAEDGFFVAVLLTRAGSEQSIKENEPPPGVTVITRRIQIETLRKLGKWDTLAQPARNLLLLPDGHWSDEQILSARPCFETLRCLRWALFLESDLTPLPNIPKMNYKESQKVFENPEKILEGRRLRPIWDIRVERNKADQFFTRCYAEAIGRGLITPETEETQNWASELNETVRQEHVRDVLAGIQTIAEIEESSLRYLVRISFQRYKCLQLLIDLQDGLNKWSEWEDLCFPAPTEEASAES